MTPDDIGVMHSAVCACGKLVAFREVAVVERKSPEGNPRRVRRTVLTPVAQGAIVTKLGFWEYVAVCPVCARERGL